MQAHLVDFRYDKYFKGEHFTHYTGAIVPLEDYQNWDKPYINQYKYEWIQGRLEKTLKMKNTEQYIIDNVLFAFEQTIYRKQRDLLSVEARCFFESINVVRIPDFAYFTKAQIIEATEGKNPVPSFVIEVIFKNDTANQVEIKLQDYKQVGVQTVWLLFPALKKVRVIQFPLNLIHDFEQDVIFSAVPPLPKFSLSANQIFMKN